MASWAQARARVGSSATACSSVGASKDARAGGEDTDQLAAVLQLIDEKGSHSFHSSIEQYGIERTLTRCTPGQWSLSNTHVAPLQA